MTMLATGEQKIRTIAEAMQCNKNQPENQRIKQMIYINKK